jgi:hypothetical protein
MVLVVENWVVEGGKKHSCVKHLKGREKKKEFGLAYLFQVPLRVAGLSLAASFAKFHLSSRAPASKSQRPPGTAPAPAPAPDPTLPLPIPPFPPRLVDSLVPPPPL